MAARQSPAAIGKQSPVSSQSTDRDLDRLGLVRCPTPKVLAAHLRDVAKILDSDGLVAEHAAGRLAQRGFPTATLGDGTGSRSNSELTSVENAAATPGKWADIDSRLAKLNRVLWKAGLDLQALVADLVAHADDSDRLPAGTGACEACNTFCRPTPEKPHNRLRSGLCDPCRKAWDKDHRPERGAWLIARRQQIKAAVDEARSRKWSTKMGNGQRCR